MKGQLGKKLAVIQKKTANKCAKFRIFFVQQAEGEKIQPRIHTIHVHLVPYDRGTMGAHFDIMYIGRNFSHCSWVHGGCNIIMTKHFQKGYILLTTSHLLLEHFDHGVECA